VHLHRCADQAEAVAAATGRLAGTRLRRVGIDGVLDDLDRQARRTKVPGRLAEWGFAWDEEDQHTRAWCPQGVTTSADAASTERVAGRQVVATSWYAPRTRGQHDDAHPGSRVSFVDVTDPVRPRYRHVLLVEAVPAGDGHTLRPVQAHAGGVVWHGPYLHVAATRRGLLTFRLDDVLRVDGTARLGLGDGLSAGPGHRYVLPLAFRYDGRAHEGTAPMRYSFCSLDRTTTPHEILAGEYAAPRPWYRPRAAPPSTRLVGYRVDPETHLLEAGRERTCRPAWVEMAGIARMQGATVVDGVSYVTASAGRHRRGSLWAGGEGAWRRGRRALPVGPEDLAYWPSTDRLWSLSEYPGRRYVFAMRRPGGG